MVGFSLNLKNKVQKPGKPGSKLLSRASLNKTNLKKNLLADDSVNEDQSKTAIDAFSEKGAMAGDEAINEEKVLVIKPPSLSTGLSRPSERTTKESSLSTIEDQARMSIINNETIDDSGLVIRDNGASPSESSEDDYEQVPVDQFGAALLRGMGWDGKDNTRSDTSLKYRQQGALLGIGSKPLPKELEKDLTADKNTKLSVPLKKREA